MKETLANPISESVIVLIACKTGAEKAVEDQIKARGMKTYCPRYLVNLRHGGMVARSLFPSYLFVWMTDQYEIVRSLIGVRDFVRRNNWIESVDPRVVDELREREGPTGYVRVDSSFFIGQTVKLKHKEDWAGVYLGMSNKYKARVLFSLLGTGLELELYERDLVTS